MNRKKSLQILVTVVILLLCLENQVYAETPEEAEDEVQSSLTSRISLERKLDEFFYLEMEASYELLGGIRENLSYASIGMGWNPFNSHDSNHSGTFHDWHNLHFSLSLGALEVGFPVKEYSPICLFEGSEIFELWSARQEMEVDLEIELLPFIGKYIGRIEILFSDNELPIAFGCNVDYIQHRGSFLRAGPEIKIKLFNIELKIADALGISNNSLIHDGRLVLMHKF